MAAAEHARSLAAAEQQEQPSGARPLAAAKQRAQPRGSALTGRRAPSRTGARQRSAARRCPAPRRRPPTWPSVGQVRGRQAAAGRERPAGRQRHRSGGGGGTARTRTASTGKLVEAAPRQPTLNLRFFMSEKAQGKQRGGGSRAAGVSRRQQGAGLQAALSSSNGSARESCSMQQHPPAAAAAAAAKLTPQLIHVLAVLREGGGGRAGKKGERRAQPRDEQRGDSSPTACRQAPSPGPPRSQQSGWRGCCGSRGAPPAGKAGTGRQAAVRQGARGGGKAAAALLKTCPQLTPGALRRYPRHAIAVLSRMGRWTEPGAA